MIYSQARPHNGLKRVSIKADTDGAPVTFLDTQWSAVPSAAALPSYLQSLHLFFFFSFSFFISQLLSLMALPRRCTHASAHISPFLLHLYSSKAPDL